MEPRKSGEEEPPEGINTKNKAERRTDDKPAKSAKENVTKNEEDELVGFSGSHGVSGMKLDVVVVELWAIVCSWGGERLGQKNGPLGAYYRADEPRKLTWLVNPPGQKQADVQEVVGPDRTGGQRTWDVPLPVLLEVGQKRVVKIHKRTILSTLSSSGYENHMCVDLYGQHHDYDVLDFLLEETSDHEIVSASGDEYYFVNENKYRSVGCYSKMKKDVKTPTNSAEKTKMLVKKTTKSCAKGNVTMELFCTPPKKTHSHKKEFVKAKTGRLQFKKIMRFKNHVTFRKSIAIRSRRLRKGCGSANNGEGCSKCVGRYVNDGESFSKSVGGSVNDGECCSKDVGGSASPRRTIDQSASGKLCDRNTKESWALLEDLALYDNASWNDPSGPHDTQYCMENLEQAFVEYASSRTDEAGGDSKPFDTLADLGSCVNIIPLYLFKKLNIGLLEEIVHVFRLANGTKSHPVEIVKDVEVHIGKLKLFNDFYVVDMKKDPETPLLVGRGFLATANAVIDCRMANIVVGEGITRNWAVIPSGFQELEVRKGDESYGINMVTKQCRCRFWEISGIPCVHVVAEYMHLNTDPNVGVSECKRRAFWSLNEDILKITILKTNTSYPSRKIRRIRSCTHQIPRGNKAQYAISRRPIRRDLDNSTSNVLISLDSWTSRLLVYRFPLSVRMTKVIKGEFENNVDVKLEDVSLICDTQLEIFNNEVNQLNGMNDNSIHEANDDTRYDPSDESFDIEEEVAEVFRIDTNLFNFETSMCKAFKEFNYLFQIDPGLLTKDIEGFKTYEDYNNGWIYEWSNDTPWVDEKPWTDAGVWTKPAPVKHTCKPFDYKTGCSEWPTYSWMDDGYCNGGNLPGTYIIGNQLHYQDYEWYEALEDSELKDEALRKKAIMEGFADEDNDVKNGELCEVRKLSVCNVWRYTMIKYSFNKDEEYVAVKENEYDDLAITTKEACQAYQEIFWIMDEGWTVTRAE
uniref:SWIM-type domain-containing protein n=1 Tax=Tanacetum cinerariifolium TaxID=118510 RepID=A0A6L2JLW0_TANCI|nr:hypothetical protein [Tanacetum cinerariifolium]